MQIKKVQRRPNPRDSKRDNFYHTTVWRKKRLEILQRDSYQCQPCKRNLKLVQANTVDHITPINQGGSKLDNSNLESTCARCHAKKSARERRNVG